jgi:mRNA interferase RelE/StbE
MDAYTVEYTNEVKLILRKLDKQIAARIVAKMLQLAAVSDSVQHKALRGQWKGYYKVRIDPYRVIYRTKREARLIIVEIIGNRDDIYDQ